MSIYDWLQDALDIEYVVSSDREYRACRIMVTCGGPNIYVDTRSGSVELYWWSDRASYPLSSSACFALDEALQELYNC